MTPKATDEAHFFSPEKLTGDSRKNSIALVQSQKCTLLLLSFSYGWFFSIQRVSLFPYSAASLSRSVAAASVRAQKRKLSSQPLIHEGEEKEEAFLYCRRLSQGYERSPWQSQ